MRQREATPSQPVAFCGREAGVPRAGSWRLAGAKQCRSYMRPRGAGYTPDGRFLAKSSNRVPFGGYLTRAAFWHGSCNPVSSRQLPLLAAANCPIIGMLRMLPSGGEVTKGKADVSRVVSYLLDGTPGQWIGFFVLIGVIGTGLWWVIRYRASLHGDSDPAAADALLVRHLREMRHSGEMSDEEYRSLKSRLRPTGGGILSPTDGLRQQAQVPGAIGVGDGLQSPDTAAASHSDIESSRGRLDGSDRPSAGSNPIP